LVKLRFFAIYRNFLGAKRVTPDLLGSTPTLG
jgi:hypothetical protein